MTVYLARLAGLTIVAAVLASSAMAQADPAHCTFPKLIYLVGSSGGVADPLGQYNVVVRNASNVPQPNVIVSLGFSATFNGGDLTKLDEGLVFNGQLYPGMTHDCLHNIVTAKTDAAGVARFRIMGMSNNDGTCKPGQGANSMLVKAGSSVVLGHATVAIADQDGNGVGIGDLSLLLADIGCGTYVARSDMDGNGTLGSNDVSVWLGIYGSAGSATNASQANACF